MKISLILALPFVATSAFAASEALECKTSTGLIRMEAGNNSNTIEIDYTPLNQRKVDTYQAPVSIMPDYYFGEGEKNLLVAIPVGAKKIVSEENLVAHVFHADGTDCFGRETSDTSFKQRYVIVGPKGEPTYSAISVQMDPKRYNFNGYIEADFACREQTVSTAGGCFAGEGDKIVWEKQK